MTKKVVWNSCTRLACACATPSPTVVICLTESSLLAPLVCTGSEVDIPFEFTTIDATLTKSWKNVDGCQNATWSYVFEYDDSLLADPNVALTSAQISGVFCKGCLTTWVEELVGNEIGVAVDEEAYTVTITSQHGCATTFSTAGIFGTTDWHTTGNSGTVDGTDFCGTIDNVPFTVRTNNKRARLTTPNTYTPVATGSDPVDAPNITDGNETNVITDGRAASILGGGIYIQSGNTNTIIGTGDTGSPTAYGSTIAGGAGNSINPDGPPDFSSVFQGVTSPVYDYGGYSTISGGADNRISWGGEPSSLGAGFHFIGGGQSGTIENAGGCATLVGGYVNFIRYPLDILDSFYGNAIAADVVVGGIVNIINGEQPDSGPIPTDALGANFIGSGINNQIDNGWQSTVVGGWNNLVSAVGAVYGVAHVDGPLSYNFLGGGAFNNLLATQTSSILGGAQSKIFGDACSTILGGMRNLIYTGAPADPQVISGSSYEVTYPGITPGVNGSFNCIAGGFGNYIEDGICSSILGGAFLALGAYSAGFQSPANRTFGFTPGTSATPYSISSATKYWQVDLRPFRSIFYMGDVDLWLGNVDGLPSKLKFFESNADTTYLTADYSSFEAQPQAANIEYVWPAAPGAVGQVLTISSVTPIPGGDRVVLVWA